MSDWMEDRDRVAAQAEELLAGWHSEVERIEGEDGEPDTIVARDGERVVAILPLDEDTVDALLDAQRDGALAQYLRDELAEASDDDLVEDEAAPDDLEAAADRWLGAADDDAADDEDDDEDDEDDDDFDLDDWDDPEADALIDELPA